MSGFSVLMVPVARRHFLAFALSLTSCLVVVAQTPVTINRSTMIDETLRPGSSHDYLLGLQRGESAVVAVRQQGVDVIVDVRNPAGKLLDSIDSPTGRSGDEIVEVIAQESGPYRLTVRPFNNNEPVGTYRLEVRALRGMSETADLLRTRDEERAAAAQWLRPRSVAIARTGIIPRHVTVPHLDELARRVRVLGLGEATHGSREFNDLRFSLTRYLVERHGYRVVTIEASVNIIDMLSSYIEGKADLTPQMLAWTNSGWIGTRTRRELYEWVRKWNRRHPHDMVRIVGVDPQDVVTYRQTLRDFISRAYGEALIKRWTPVEEDLAAADQQVQVFGDSGVETTTRQLLLDIIASMKLDAPILKSRFGASTFESAFDAAQALAEFADFNSGGRNAAINHSRDWYMAARVLRALESKGRSAKAVYWAHNAHVAHPGSDRTTGGVLRNTLGCQYAALAVTFDEGAFVAQVPNNSNDDLAIFTLPPAPDNSIESVVRKLGFEGAFAAWGCLSPTSKASTVAERVPEWFKTPRPMHWVGGLYKPDSLPTEALQNFNLLQDFDGIIFLSRVTAEDIPPGRPRIPARKR